MAKIDIRPAAREDLVGIWSYIAQDNERAADRFIQKFDTTFHLLADLPYSGQPRPELGSGIRSRPIHKYVVFYCITSEGVEILRVLHGSQDIESIFQ